MHFILFYFSDEELRLVLDESSEEEEGDAGASDDDDEAGAAGPPVPTPGAVPISGPSQAVPAAARRPISATAFCGAATATHVPRVQPGPLCVVCWKREKML